MRREMAHWQTFTMNPAMYGRDRCSQQKLGFTQAVFGCARLCSPQLQLFTPRCLHPPPLADNHRTVLSFLHSSPFSLSLHLWPGRSFHSSSCAATQKVRPSPKFHRNFTARPWVSNGTEEMRRRRGREECVCNT